MKTVHGHEVMDFIKKNKITKKELLSRVEEKFNNCFFETCKQKDMMAKELLDFLINKEKVIFEKDIAKIQEKNICNE